MSAKSSYSYFRKDIFALLLVFMLNGCSSIPSIPFLHQSQAPISATNLPSKVATASPSATDSPAVPSNNVASNVAAGFYKINPGDNLESVADAFGWSIDEIAQWNNISDSAALVPGQILRVSPPPVKPASSAMVTILPPQGSVAQLSFLWPAKGRVVSLFVPGKQSGIIIADQKNQVVNAVASGIVVYAGNSIPRYGNMVIIRHVNHFVTAYYYAGKILVKEGDQVQAGQAVAQMGTPSQDQLPAQLLSNLSNQFVIGFEIRLNGQLVDPLTYLPINSN